jgi:hypothetical protein
MEKKEKELLFINQRNGDWPTWEIQRNIETDFLKKECYSDDILNSKDSLDSLSISTSSSSTSLIFPTN